MDTVRVVWVATRATTVGALLMGFSQGQSRDHRSQRYTYHGTSDTANGRTAADLLISQGFGDVFEPICHGHLLFLCKVLCSRIL